MFANSTEENGFRRRQFLQAAGGAAGIYALAGCTDNGNNDDDDEQAAEDAIEDLPELSITVAHVSPADPSERDHAGALAFKNYMESRSGGQAEVEISPAGELGDIFEIADQAIDGIIEVAAGATEAHLSVYHSDYTVAGVPYAFPDNNLANYVLDHEWGQDLLQGFEEETDTRVIAWYGAGDFDCFSFSGQQIDSLEDFEGQSIRVIEAPSHAAFVEELGASPQNVEWTELYEALDQGVVDGQKNPVQTFVTGNFEEVQDYILLDRHQWSFMNTFVSQQWYEELDPAYQQMVDTAGAHWMMQARKTNRIMRENLIEYVSEAGVTIETPDEAFIDDLREQTQEPVSDVIREQMDNPEKLDNMFEAIDEAREIFGYPEE